MIDTGALFRQLDLDLPFSNPHLQGGRLVGRLVLSARGAGHSELRLLNTFPLWASGAQSLFWPSFCCVLRVNDCAEKKVPRFRSKLFLFSRLPCFGLLLLPSRAAAMNPIRAHEGDSGRVVPDPPRNAWYRCAGLLASQPQLLFPYIWHCGTFPMGFLYKGMDFRADFSLVPSGK
jgi:hypothetical protein